MEESLTQMLLLVLQEPKSLNVKRRLKMEDSEGDQKSKLSGK